MADEHSKHGVEAIAVDYHTSSTEDDYSLPHSDSLGPSHRIGDDKCLDAGTAESVPEDQVKWQDSQPSKTGPTAETRARWELLRALAGIDHTSPRLQPSRKPSPARGPAETYNTLRRNRSYRKRQAVAPSSSSGSIKPLMLPQMVRNESRSSQSSGTEGRSGIVSAPATPPSHRQAQSFIPQQQESRSQVPPLRPQSSQRTFQDQHEQDARPPPGPSQNSPLDHGGQSLTMLGGPLPEHLGRESRPQPNRSQGDTSRLPTQTLLQGPQLRRGRGPIAPTDLSTSHYTQDTPSQPQHSSSTSGGLGSPDLAASVLALASGQPLQSLASSLFSSVPRVSPDACPSPSVTPFRQSSSFPRSPITQVPQETISQNLRPPFPTTPTASMSPQPIVPTSRSPVPSSVASPITSPVTTPTTLALDSPPLQQVAASPAISVPSITASAPLSPTQSSAVASVVSALSELDFAILLEKSPEQVLRLLAEKKVPQEFLSSPYGYEWIMQGS
ncbi:MAG: hypothetical protein Q9227_004581 [Pyrenula ochraceoflavens]